MYVCILVTTVKSIQMLTEKEDPSGNAINRFCRERTILSSSDISSEVSTTNRKKRNMEDIQLVRMKSL